MSKCTEIKPIQGCFKPNDGAESVPVIIHIIYDEEGASGQAYTLADENETPINIATYLGGGVVSVGSCESVVDFLENVKTTCAQVSEPITTGTAWVNGRPVSVANYQLVDNRDPFNQVVSISGSTFTEFVNNLELAGYTEWSSGETHYFCPCPEGLVQQGDWFINLNGDTLTKLACSDLSTLPNAPNKAAEIQCALQTKDCNSDAILEELVKPKTQIVENIICIDGTPCNVFVSLNVETLEPIKVVLASDYSEVLPPYKFAKDCACEDDCAQYKNTYSILDNQTDLEHSSNNTSLKWQPTTGANTAGATAFTQSVMDCIDNNGSARILYTDQNDVGFEFVAVSYTGTSSTDALFTGQPVGATGAGNVKTASIECNCEEEEPPSQLCDSNGDGTGTPVCTQTATCVVYKDFGHKGGDTTLTTINAVQIAGLQSICSNAFASDTVTGIDVGNGAEDVADEINTNLESWINANLGNFGFAATPTLQTVPDTGGSESPSFMSLTYPTCADWQFEVRNVPSAYNNVGFDTIRYSYQNGTFNTELLLNGNVVDASQIPQPSSYPNAIPLFTCP